MDFEKSKSKVSPDSLVLLGVPPRLAYVLRPVSAQQVVTAAICLISSTAEMKHVIGVSASTGACLC
jgi:hypothetical protein